VSIQVQPAMATSLPIDYDKRLMLFSGRANPELASRIADKLGVDLGLTDLVVVAPDAGRVKLNKKFASKLGAELAILDKERPAQQVAEIGYVIGDVKGKTAVLVDDMIDTAGTLRAAAQTVLDEGASRVYAAATHPILSGNAYENLAASGFEQIVVTDTIPIRAGAPDNLRVLSCAELLTDSIRRIFTDDSVSEVFGGENQLF